MVETPPSRPPGLTRRALLAGLGAGAGLLAARGLGTPALYAGNESTIGTDEAIRRVAVSLTPRQRELIVFPYDHPTRQIANTIAVIARPHLGTLLSPTQRAGVEELYLSLLSARGREAFAGTVAVEGRLDGCVLALYGEPEGGRTQAVLMGGHLMLRGGGDPTESAAFGGGIAYGHQTGNGHWRVPGNSFAFHGDAANRVYAQLSPAERALAVLPTPPHELVLQVRGAGGTFPGARVGDLSEAAQDELGRLLATVLVSYPEAEQARARDAIDANGGPGALHVSYFASHGFYEDMASFASLDEAERTRRGDPYWQVWRLEGPGTIVHFKGSPHVHAYVQVVRDPRRANVGETLATTSDGLEGEALRALLERTLRSATGEPLAFHSNEIPGRFCPGEITTGLAYSLDPYRSHVVVATIEGRAMAAPLRDRLAAAGTPVEESQRYRIATLEYFAGRPDLVGKPERVDTSALLLRDALVSHLRAGGLASATG